MESRLSMDRSHLVSLCSLARKKAHSYYDIIEFSFGEDDRAPLALGELRGIRECLARALALAERMIKEAENGQQG